MEGIGYLCSLLHANKLSDELCVGMELPKVLFIRDIVLETFIETDKKILFTRLNVSIRLAIKQT